MNETTMGPCGARRSSEREQRAGAVATRREVLRSLALGAAALPWIGQPGLARAAQDSAGAPAASAAAAGSLPKLAVVTRGTPEALTRRALEALGGLQRFVSPGARVVIKPNIGWDRTPEQGANTHPAVVATLVEMALAAGARRVAVMDHTCNDARRCYARSGIEAAAKAAGADVLHLPDGRGTTMSVGGEVVGEWPVHREVIEADVLINVPAAKHHSLCLASLGMKNWLGAVDGRRNQLHQQIHHASVDLAAFFEPALTVMDATRLLLRNGPQGGNLDDVRETRTIIAGTDPVAIDARGGALLELTAADLPHLAMAEARGLGHAALPPSEVVEIDLEA